MHSILWASIISAGVALVTTLLVEYLAKPSLEARKERILEGKRNTRLTVGKLQRILFLSAAIGLWQKTNKRSPLRKRTTRLTEELEALATELISMDVLQDLPAYVTVSESWTGSISTIIATSIALQEFDVNDKSLAEFDAARQELEHCLYLLKTPRWMYRKRRKLVQLLKQPIEGQSELPTWDRRVSPVPVEPWVRSCYTSDAATILRNR